MSAMTSLDIARLRLVNQRIAAPLGDTPEETVAALGALQAQDYRNALWAVGLRATGASEADVERALASGVIVRTWAMRGTLHLVAPADVRWMLGLLAPRIIAQRALRRRQLELDEATLARSRSLLAEALCGGRQLARAEAMALLERAGIQTAGQRGIHILSHLSLEGLLCQTAASARQPTFVLLDEWVPATGALSRAEALAELASRYLSSHGPATLSDFAWWSGLTVGDARAGFERVKARCEIETVGAAVYWMLTRPPVTAQAARLYLLPAYDEYVLGYAERGIVLDAVASERVVPGGNGVFRPTIVADGRVAGTWRLGYGARRSAVAELFAPLDAAASDALAAGLGAYDRWAGWSR